MMIERPVVASFVTVPEQTYPDQRVRVAESGISK